MPMGAADDWKRLGQRVVARRKQRGLDTRHALAANSGLSYRLLGDLERGARQVSEGTLAVVEQALGWAPGSMRRILRGFEPMDLYESTIVTYVPRSDDDDERSASAMRALGSAYEIAAEITESGDGDHGDRLGKALGDIGHSLMTPLDSVAGGGFIQYRKSERGSSPEIFQESSPTVLRIAFGRYMEHLRKERGLGFAEVGKRMDVSADGIELLENGRATFKRAAMDQLLSLYGIDDPSLRRECIELSSAASSSGWWTRYNDILPKWFTDYISLEQRATIIRTFEMQYIPGLLQTAAYASTVIDMPFTKGGVDRRVAARMERQKILSRSNPPILWAVIDEAAFARPLNAPNVMRDQIDHLIEMSKRDNIRIQILPFDAVVSDTAVSFSILRFNNVVLKNEYRRVPDIVYTEQLTSALYMDRDQDVTPYRDLMDALCVKALSLKGSRDFLIKTRESLNMIRMTRHRQGKVENIVDAAG